MNEIQMTLEEYIIFQNAYEGARVALANITTDATTKALEFHGYDTNFHNQATQLQLSLDYYADILSRAVVVPNEPSSYEVSLGDILLLNISSNNFHKTAVVKLVSALCASSHAEKQITIEGQVYPIHYISVECPLGSAINRQEVGSIVKYRADTREFTAVIERKCTLENVKLEENIERR